MKIQITYIQRFFIFLLIFFSSASSVLSKNDILFLFFFFLLILVHIYLGAKKDYYKIISLICFIVLVVSYYRYVNFNTSIYTWFGWGLRILFAFLVVRINKANFIPNFLKVMQFIALFSIIGYLLQLLAPKLLFGLGNILDIGLGEGFKKRATFFIFNFSMQHSLRNAGCMWEPGAYGAILNISLLLLSIPNYKFYSQKMYIIFVVAVLTTFSTDAYLGLAAIIFYTNIKISNIYKKVFNFIIVIPLLLIIFFNTEFLSDKIANQYKEIDTQLYKANKYDKMILSRFASLVIDFPVFIKRPLLGYGIDLKEVNGTYLYKEYDQDIDRTYGGFTMLLYFGFFGILIYFGSLFNQFLKISNSLSYAFYSVVVMLILLYSNPLPYSPLLFSLFFIHKRSENIENSIIEKI